MQTTTTPWKSELSAILAEDDRRQAKADEAEDWSGPRHDLCVVVGQMEDWAEDLPAPKTDKGKARRAELLAFIERLDDIWKEMP